jgi:hypothetical protein
MRCRRLPIKERARRKKKAIRVHNCTSRTDLGEEDREAE